MRSALAALLLAAPAATATTVNYYGGPVIENAKVYVVYWGAGSQLDAAVTAPAGGMADFFAGVLNSSYIDWLNQYDTDLPAQAGSHHGAAGTAQHIGRGNYAGTYEMTHVPPGNVTDAIVQQQLLAAIDSGELPPDDPNSVYAIYFPASVAVDSSCKNSNAGFAGYHGITSNTASLDDPVYMVLASCASDGDYFGSLSSHELIEAITDRAPTPGDVPDYPQAWNDLQAFELADICEDLPDSSVSTPLGTFTVQTIWDVANTFCDVRHVFAQDFSVAVVPTVADVQPGQSLQIAVQTATTSGAPQPLSLSVNAPPGITATLDQATVTSGSLATLTLSAAAGASVPRDAQVIVRADGTSGSGAQIHTAAVLVQPAEFSLLVGRPSADLKSGGSVTFVVSTTALHGDAGPIALAVSGLPTGVTATLSAATLNATGTATLTLKDQGAAAQVGAGVVVTATGTTARHVASSVYNILPPPSGGCASIADPAWLGALALLAARRKRR